jgi:hypothetical protein
VPSSIPDVENNQQDTAEIEGEEEEDEGIDESVPVASRGHRGIARRNARRARGRRGGATRARVISTRIHGGRRPAALPSAIDNEDNNATLEETVNTETEESPKKSTIPSQTEPKPVETQPLTEPTSATPIDETSLSSHTNAGANVRVSGKTQTFI